MKTRLSIVVVLALAAVLLVSGSTGAQQGYTQYLPLFGNNFCTPKVSAYVSADRPVVRVGETMTVTGAIVNECAPLVGEPYFTIRTDRAGILAPTTPGVDGHYDVPVGAYRTLTLTLSAVGVGSVLITGGMIYETVNDFYPPGLYFAPVAARPIEVRVMSP